MHWINSEEIASNSGQFFDKENPAEGGVLVRVTRGNADDVNRAVTAAQSAYENWKKTPVIKRADVLREAVLLMRARKDEIAELIAVESGKPKREALGEVGAAVECGFFFAGEGRRYFGQVLQSATPNRTVQMIRQSIGVGALITPYNNPLAGIAWKTFPALLCGNTVVMKSHEYTPYIGVWFANILKEAGLPAGVFNVVQGSGMEVGAPLTADARVKFVSLTGSVATGQKIIQATADRLAKVSIEAGGKNPFVVCDDADLERAASTAVAAGFVDGGQRCAAASRIIIFDTVYEQFKRLFLERVSQLKVGAADTDNFGAMISEKRMNEVLGALEGAKKGGAAVLCGGERMQGEQYKNGFFIQPTVLENVSPDAEVSCNELFGPVVILYHVKNFDKAVELANNAQFKLSSAIHTSNIHRAQEFIDRYEGGVVRVNGPTQGSEPHMPFGGVGLSGNGWREPGTNALDFYSEWKQVSIDHSPSKV